MTHAVFVYGTLRPGQSNAHLWRDALTQIEAGICAGTLLFDLGPYPMAIRGDGTIRGEILHFAPARWERMIRALDRYEGSGYTREIVRVETASGEIAAWIYLGHEKIARRGRLLESGDWNTKRPPLFARR